MVLVYRIFKLSSLLELAIEIEVNHDSISYGLSNAVPYGENAQLPSRKCRATTGALRPLVQKSVRGCPLL